MRLISPLLASVATTLAITLFAPTTASAALAPITGSGSVRISGPDRFATSAEISKSIATPRQDTIYVASAEAFPDALAAGPVASATESPILLVGRDRLPESVSKEISRLSPDRIVLVGGSAAVSDDVLAQLQTIGDGATVTRVAGPTRYGTAASLTAHFTSIDELFVVSGEGFADALAAGAAAAQLGTGIILTATTALPAESAAELSRLAPATVTVVGGTLAVDEAVLDAIRAAVPHAEVRRVAGDTRYETSAQLAKQVWPTGAEAAFLASGAQFPDALAGTPAAAQNAAPILLTRSACHPEVTVQTLDALAPNLRIHLGGPAATYMGADVCIPAAPPAPAQPPPLSPTAKKLTLGFDPPSAAASRAALEGLAVSAPASMAGYSRDLFPHWRDADAWGWPPIPNGNCDVRQAALYRDGIDVRVNQHCTVQSGSWLDPYTGVTLNDRSSVHIDHIVPLAEAWRSGAQTWNLETATRFANDPLEVMAVDGDANMNKGDKTPDAWKPPVKDTHCLYAQRWVAIKDKWNLTVKPTEKAALHQMIDTCTS